MQFRPSLDRPSFNLFYTIENWKTAEIRYLEAPKKILGQTFFDILQLMLVHDCRVYNFHELFFFLIFNADGWRIYSLPLGSKGFKQYVFSHIVEYYGIEPDALHGRGCPDFLLTKDIDGKKEFIFAEVKCTEKTLNKFQAAWAERYQNYDLYITKPAFRDINAEQNILINRVAR